MFASRLVVLTAICVVSSAIAYDFTPAHFKATRLIRASQLRENTIHWDQVLRLPQPPKQNILQPLDHYNALNTVFFNQSFWLNTAFMSKSTPPPSAASPLAVFAFVCAEETCEVGAVLGGEHVDLAKKHGAAIVALQHRFYGTAQPFGDRNTAHLSGLSAQQALADWATLLTAVVLPSLNASAPGAARVVTFGGSYGGQLAAWLRLKYPHLIHAAIASSAPVSTALEYVGYDDVVGQALGDPAVGGSAACVSTLSTAFTAVADALTGTNATARSEAVAALVSCTDLTASPLDPPFALTSTSSIFKGIVQTNGQSFASYGIAPLCSNLSASVGSGRTPLGALKAFLELYIKTEWGGGCQSLGYNDFNRWLQNSSVAGPDYRLWFWQTCTEQGKAQTSRVPGSRSPFSPLGQTMEQYYQQCAEIFGNGLSFSLAQSLMAFSEANFGGQNISATRVVYVNGSRDPWSAAGILTSLGDLQPAVVIEGASHCANMCAPSPTDSPAMTQARATIAAYLEQFLTMATD